jgi:putative transposase
VYYWFQQLMRRMLFKTIHDLALMLHRMCSGPELVPSAGVVDSQSVKGRAAPEQGYDANKKLKGRKRHIAADTDGRLLAMNPTPADVADSTGGQRMLDALRKRWPWLMHRYAKPQ